MRKGSARTKLLVERYKLMRVVRLPIEVGIKPETLQVVMSNSYKDGRFPIEFGSLPKKLVFASLNIRSGLLL